MSIAKDKVLDYIIYLAFVCVILIIFLPEETVGYCVSVYTSYAAIASIFIRILYLMRLKRR